MNLEMLTYYNNESIYCMEVILNLAKWGNERLSFAELHCVPNELYNLYM